MHCQACDYPLWNLTAHACPECGTPFRASEFRFAANSVRYCCPECNQSYFGTTEDGHLDPAEFDCVRCGSHLVMDEMIVRPRDDVREQDTAPDRMPWLDRGPSGGRIRAWLATIGLALGQPVRLMRAIPPQSSIGRAWWFAILTQTAIMLVSIVPLMMVMGLFGVAVANSAGGGGGPTNKGLLLGFSFAAGIGLIAAVLGTLALLGLWGVIAHGILAATGGAAHSIGHTYRALCYSSAANVVTAVPCLGQYFGWIWWVVSAVLMVREGQRVSGPRATFAVLIGPVLMLGAGAAVYVWAIFMALTSANAAQVSAFGQSDAQYTGAALQGIVDDQGVWPSHPLELFDEFGTGAFIMSSTPTTADDIVLDDEGLTLGDLFDAGDNRQRAMLDALLADVDTDWTALRIGDAVFMYNGIDPDVNEPGLWTVVMAAASAADGSYSVTIGEPVMWAVRLDGIIVPLHEPVAQVLELQNDLRALHGLPPLEDPRSVR